MSPADMIDYELDAPARFRNAHRYDDPVEFRAGDLDVACSVCNADIGRPCVNNAGRPGMENHVKVHAIRAAIVANVIRKKDNNAPTDSVVRHIIELGRDTHVRTNGHRLFVDGVAFGDRAPEPVPMILTCPSCRGRHIDVGEFATKVHHTHACQSCGMVWRPAIVPTVGVQFLPGFRNYDEDDNRRAPSAERLILDANATPPFDGCYIVACPTCGAPRNSVCRNADDAQMYNVHDARRWLVGKTRSP